jgi:hypothetical protein
MRWAKDTNTVLAPFAVGAVAIVCAGLPALAAVFAGSTLATIRGIGGGLVALIGAVAGRSRSCAHAAAAPCPPTPRPSR